MFSNKDTVAKSLYEDKLNELAMADKRITALTNEIESHKDTVESLSGELERVKAQHKLEQKDFESQLAILNKSVASRVNTALASLGVKNFAVEQISSSGVLTPATALEKFNALSVEERHEFYIKHKELINRASSVVPSVSNQ
jgi:predicted RNase H-like nuclease (RuvC/YqgF family)